MDQIHQTCDTQTQTLPIYHSKYMGSGGVDFLKILLRNSCGHCQSNLKWVHVFLFKYGTEIQTLKPTLGGLEEGDNWVMDTGH